MTPRDALAAARAAGIRLSIEGTGLALEADRAPPPTVAHLVAEHKPAIMALLVAEAAEALARATTERDRAGLAGYPADDAERGEREAIEAESRGELTAPAPLPGYIEGLKKIAVMRPPRFSAPARWWTADRAGWCTGCGQRSTWHADPSPAPTTATALGCDSAASDGPPHGA